MDNPTLQISLKKMEAFLYASSSCINDVDVPLLLESLLRQLKHPIPGWLVNMVDESHERIETGLY